MRVLYPELDCGAASNTALSQSAGTDIPGRRLDTIVQFYVGRPAELRHKQRWPRSSLYPSTSKAHVAGSGTDNAANSPPSALSAIVNFPGSC